MAGYADLDEYALLHQAARWARGESVALEPRPGDGRVRPGTAAAWRGILLRRPTWRATGEIRASFEGDAVPQALIDGLGSDVPGQVRIDVALVDARPADATATDSLLAIESRDGRPAPTLSSSLGGCRRGR